MQKSDKTIWPIGLAFGIAAFMLSILGAVIFSFTQNVDLVESDYYQKEVIYEQQIARMQRTHRLEEKPVFKIDRPANQLVLQFPAQFSNLPVTGEIEFFRPSDAALDCIESLELDANLQQKFPIDQFKSGFWKIKLNWTADSLEYYHEQSLTLR